MPDPKKMLHDFVFPPLNRKFLFRLTLIAAGCFLLFRFIAQPVFLNGPSMEPNYHHGSFNLIWKPAYWFRKPKIGDVVALKYENDKIMLLKRIVGLPGDTVEFRRGRLYVNGKVLKEPYVKQNRNDWNLSPRKVDPGFIYVVGDNRSMPIQDQKFGAIAIHRLKGTLLL